MYKNITKVLFAFIFIASMGKQHAASHEEGDISYTYILNGKEYAYNLSSNSADAIYTSQNNNNFEKLTLACNNHILYSNAMNDISKKWWLWSCFFNVTYTGEVQYGIPYGFNNKEVTVTKNPNQPRNQQELFSFLVRVNLCKGEKLKRVTIVLEKKFKPESICYIGMVSVGIQFLWNHRNALWQYLNGKLAL